MSLVSISRRLAREADALRFAAPVTHVYNPLRYARRPHEAYLERYGGGQPSVLLLGMNPGPFGMAQTGVPFGDVALVREWLGIEGSVDKPANEHPKRPVQGFECTRSEVSGSRLWGWAKSRFGTPARFFERFFVANYCPLVFMEASARNRTPDKLKSSERSALFRACDQALRDVVVELEPRHVVGVGNFAASRARAALTGLAPRVGCVLHPSPANPRANRGWASAVEKQLRDLSIRV
jgi:single-strand selective monofunctional uracil DNA glycosylase